MTSEQEESIDAAELKVQRIYEKSVSDDGVNLLSALQELQQCYARCGLISNKVTMVNSLVTVIEHFTNSIFLSETEREARRQESERLRNEAKIQKIKDELYAEYLEEQKAE